MDVMAMETYFANLDAEQSIIGGILLEPEMLEDCILKPEHFFDPRHQNLFWTMRDLESKNIPVDIVSIVDRVGQSKVADIGGVSYITEMAGAIPTVANFNYYQRLVLEYYERRMQYEIAREIMQKTPENEPGEVREQAIEKLTALDENDLDDNDDGHVSNVLVRVYDWMEQDHGDITGAPTGFDDLDKMLSGLQRQDLVIIGARPSMGKTALAVNICQNYSIAASKQDKKGGPAVIFSLEMPDEGLAKRMLSSGGNISAIAMRNPLGNFESSDWTKTTMAMGELSNAPLHIFDKSGVDVSYIRQKLRMIKRKYPDEHIIAVVDYLQLIVGSPRHGGNRTAEIGEISRQLKHIARELDLTVIALSQLSRGVEQRQDKRPMMSDLRESGQIEQDADVIGFMYRDDYYNADSEIPNVTEIIIAKQRNGPIGTVELAFIKEYNKFVNLDYKHGGA